MDGTPVEPIHEGHGHAAVPSPRHRAALVEGAIAPTLLRFALPILASNVLQALNTSINAAWIGQLLGARALSASANANALLFLLMSACFGLGIAASILVGQSFGARDLDQAKRVVGTVFVFFTAVAVATALAGLVGTPLILAAMGTPTDSLPLAEAYMRLIFLALPAMYLFTFVMMGLRGAGDSVTPFVFLGVSAALDVALNPLLIRGIGPLPPLGIAGSALATLIAQWSTLLAMIVWLYRSGNELCLARGELGYLRLDPRIMHSLVTKGLPISLQVVVMSFSLIVLISLVDRYGSQTVAAYGACFQVWSYIQMPAFALGSACSSMAAQNIGAERWDRVGRVAVIGVVYSIVATGGLVVAVTSVDRHAYALFLGDDTVAIAIARHIHAIVSWSFILFGISFVMASVVRAAGAVIAPLLIMVVAFLGLRVPAAVVLTPWLGADAIYWAFPIGSFASVVMTTLYYRHGSWRRARMF